MPESLFFLISFYCCDLKHGRKKYGNNGIISYLVGPHALTPENQLCMWINQVFTSSENGIEHQMVTVLMLK